MREYVRECLQKHPPDQFPVEFVQCVFRHAKEKARDKEMILKATRALVDLSRRKGADAFITFEEIAIHAGTGTSASGGLWIWLANHADVVEQQPGVRAYRIRNDFYEAFQRLVDRAVVKPARHSILELQGLGKEVWAGIDAQAYVDRERSAWAG